MFVAFKEEGSTRYVNIKEIVEIQVVDDSIIITDINDAISAIHFKSAEIAEDEAETLVACASKNGVYYIDEEDLQDAEFNQDNCF